MSTTDRAAFRQALAEVAVRARAILPQETNGRLESAVKLVLLDEVQVQENGSIQVGSTSDPAKVYTLTGISCDCQDYPHAPASWCKHRIAAGLHRRVRETLAAQAVPTQAPQALPEAPASVNCHLTISGRQVQLTLRDTDETRLLERLRVVLDQYPVPQPVTPAPRTNGTQALSPQQHNAAAMHKRVTDFCPVHQVAMKQNHGKDGRTWYSHYDEAAGRWCKGK
jgi:hypothetical protein